MNKKIGKTNLAEHFQHMLLRIINIKFSKLNKFAKYFRSPTFSMNLYSVSYYFEIQLDVAVLVNSHISKAYK